MRTRAGGGGRPRAATKPLLVVVACSRTKIWERPAREALVAGTGVSFLRHRAPAGTAVPARLAYTGDVFVCGRVWAERRGLPWVILSAKHGILQPERPIRKYDRKLATKAEASRLARRFARELAAIGAAYAEVFLVGGTRFYRHALRSLSPARLDYLRAVNQHDLRRRALALLDAGPAAGRRPGPNEARAAVRGDSLAHRRVRGYGDIEDAQGTRPRGARPKEGATR